MITGEWIVVNIIVGSLAYSLLWLLAWLIMKLGFYIPPFFYPPKNDSQKEGKKTLSKAIRNEIEARKKKLM